VEESGYLEDRKDFLEEMPGLSKMRRYKDKEVITRQGEYDCYMLIIIPWRVRILKMAKPDVPLLKRKEIPFVSPWFSSALMKYAG